MKQLRRNLAAARNTVFGKQHDFTRLSVASNAELLKGYQAATGVQDWLGVKDFVVRMREGAEPDVLWPGLVRDFAQTSGTTAGDKFIPVSAAMLKSNLHASMDIFGHMSRFGVSLPRLTGGKSLFLGGSSDLATSDKGIRTGDLSGIISPLIRWPISFGR